MKATPNVVTMGVLVVSRIRLIESWCAGRATCLPVARTCTNRISKHTRIFIQLQRYSPPGLCSSVRTPSFSSTTAVVSSSPPPTSQNEERRTEEVELLRYSTPDEIATLPKGIPEGFYVVKQYVVPETSVQNWYSIGLTVEDIERVQLTPHNITLPVALMLLDPSEYPSMSRARKACRKGNILIHKGPVSSSSSSWDDPETCQRGRVGDRVCTGDILGRQVRIGSGYFPILSYKQPPFELPVLLEDDHFAVVNKPAGIVVYNQRKGGHGIMTVRAQLPFVLQPPKPGTYSVMRRPASVHRLDKPTSGILCVAKTKPAMLSLSRQFHDRIVKKTYMAIVNGIPQEDPTASITSKEAFELGVDVDPTDESTIWQLIDSPLEEKQALTVWRAVRYVKSLHAHDGVLTLVELKPKTGRYHQLRRHMAWVCQRPLVGDAGYDRGTPEAMKFRERGLFLCSSSKLFRHPFYNSNEGRAIWEGLGEEAKYKGGKLFVAEDDKVMVRVSVDLPEKFETLLQREEERYSRLGSVEVMPAQ